MNNTTQTCSNSFNYPPHPTPTQQKTKKPCFLLIFAFFCCFLTLEYPKRTQIQTVPGRVAAGFVLGLELNLFQVCRVKLGYEMRDEIQYWILF